MSQLQTILYNGELNNNFLRYLYSIELKQAEIILSTLWIR